jgi:ABC-type Na+ efflux pump permease subunit
MISRIGLIVTGLAFGLWEAVDIFRIDVPAVAAVFAAVFLGCTAWFWRRGSVKAVGVLMLFFAFEAAMAPSLKDASTATKATVIPVGIAGVAAAIAVLVAERRAKRSSGRGLAEAGS